jgi:hypothetical protein
MVLCYHREIKQLIFGRYCSYQKFGFDDFILKLEYTDTENEKTEPNNGDPKRVRLVFCHSVPADSLENVLNDAVKQNPHPGIKA